MNAVHHLHADRAATAKQALTAFERHLDRCDLAIKTVKAYRRQEQPRSESQRPENLGVKALWSASGTQTPTRRFASASEDAGTPPATPKVTAGPESPSAPPRSSSFTPAKARSHQPRSKRSSARCRGPPSRLLEAP